MTDSPTRPYWTRLLLFAVAVGLTACSGAQEDDHQEFRARRARMSLAGRGDEVEEGFTDLSLSRTHSLEEMGFFLLGGRILDMGMLAALVDDGALLGGAPLRPSPGRPDARYYFWAVEGDPEHLGRYGENSLELPSTNWRFITFGMNYVNGEANAARNALEDRFEELMEAHPEGTPALFAQELSVPLLTLEDSKHWASVTTRVSRDLVERLMESGPNIPGFFRTLPSGQYAQDRLAEFVVWYYHLAFAWAIDHLEEEGAIVIPSSGFASLILYAEDEGGLLKGF